MLRKPSQILRTTVSQEIREILGPEPDAPAGSYREVQLLMPESPLTYVALGNAGSPPPDLAESTGLNRTYKLPAIPTGAQIVVRLLPEQNIWAASHAGLSLLSIVVEYVSADGVATPGALEGRLQVARRRT